MEIMDELRGVDWPMADHPISFYAEAGLSNRAADLDNIIKPLLDTLQTIYKQFNDNKVYHIELHKAIVPKGDEYIYFRLGFYKPGEVRIRAGRKPTAFDNTQEEIKTTLNEQES